MLRVAIVVLGERKGVLRQPLKLTERAEGY